MDESRLFMESSTCADQLFDFGPEAAGTLIFPESHFFIDPDRSRTQTGPDEIDGIIKKKDLAGQDVFLPGCFPDEIAAAGTADRYWFPFHRKAEKILADRNIELIMDCRTVMAIGPAGAPDRGRPRPLFSVQTSVETGNQLIKTCSGKTAWALLSALKNEFNEKEYEGENSFVMSRRPAEGYIMEKYGMSGIPALRLNMSKALFINSTHFSPEYLKVDKLRIEELKEKLRKALRNFAAAAL